MLLDAGAPVDVSARGDGGTPLVVALFWGHRGPPSCSAGRAAPGQPARRRRARATRPDRRAGRADGSCARGRRAPRLLPPARRLPGLAAGGRPAGGARRGARRGPRAATAPRRSSARRARRGRRGRRLPRHRAAWAAAVRRTDAVRALLALGADPSGVSTFGGPTHGEGVTPLHLAAQGGHLDAIRALLEAGADPTLARRALRRHARRLGGARRAEGRAADAGRQPAVIRRQLAAK